MDKKQMMDPIRIGLIWRRIEGVVDQVAETFLRAAFSVVVRDNYDMAFSLFDSQGRLIAQSKRSIPSFTGTLPRTLEAVLERYPVERLGGFLRTDRRDRVGIELIVIAPGPQGHIHYLQDFIVDEEVADTLSLGEKRMQPFCMVTDKITLPTGLAAQVGIEVRQHRVDSLGSNGVFNNDAAVTFDDVRQLAFAGG